MMDFRMDDVGKALRQGDVESRRAAVLSLRGCSTELRAECLGYLVVGLTDQSWRVRKTAQDILYEEYRPEEYVDRLIKLLYIEDNAGARNSAIELLTRLNRRATPFLIEAFRTGNADVRKFIIDVLGEFRDRRALQVMLDALKDEDENVRASAVEHLGKLGEPMVVDSLIDILEKGDLWTAYPAADALGRIGDRRAIPALVKALEMKKSLREPVMKALAAMGDENIVPFLVPYIRDGARSIQEEALKAIEKLYIRGVSEEAIAAALKDGLGDAAIDVLLEHAWSPKGEVRISAILLLGLLRDERALNSLLELSLEGEFAEDAGRALVFIGKDKPETLLPLFGNENPYLRRFITRVAGQVASPLYYDIFLESLNHEDGHVRSLSARGLAAIGDKRAIPRIMGLLSDSYPDVQEAAVEALCALGEGLDVASVMGLLQDKNPSVRKNAAALLGRMGAAEAVESLGFALKDESPVVRKSVVSALASIRTPESVKHLILALTDEDAAIRSSAAISLGAIGGAEVVEPLCLLLTDTEDKVKAAAAKALGAADAKEAVPLIIKLLHDANGFVVTAAMKALGKLGGAEARTAILEMLGSPDLEIRRTAIKAFSVLGPEEAVEHIAPYLNDPDWATRMAAVEALGEQQAARGRLESLLDTEEDQIVRKTIERLLGV